MMSPQHNTVHSCIPVHAFTPRCTEGPQNKEGPSMETGLHRKRLGVARIWRLFQRLLQRDTARIEQQSLEASLRYDALFNHSTDGVFILSLDGVHLEVSPRGAEILGYEPHELVGKSITTTVDPSEQASAEDMVSALLEGKEIPIYERTFRAKDGTQVPAEINVTLVRDSNGKPAFIQSVMRDISKRKRLEEKLRRTTRALRTLSQGNQVLVRAEDEQSLLDGFCRVIREKGEYCLAWVGYAQEDEQKSIRVAAQAGYDEGYLDLLNFTWADDATSPAGTAIRTGGPSVVRSVRTDPAVAQWREEATQRGYASILALPLAVDETIFGALCIYAPEPDAFDDDELTLLREMADDLSFGLGALRGLARRREAESRLLRNKELLDRAEIIGQFGSWEWDLTSNEVIWSDEMYRLLGHALGEPETVTFETFLSRVHPDDMKSVQLALDEARESKRKFEFEFRVVTPSNGERVLLALGEVICDESGTPVRLVGASRDITERMLAVERLNSVFQATIRALAATTASRDPYTGAHQESVAKLAEAIAREMGLPEHRIEGIRIAGYIHDIGKVSVPAEILTKPGALSDAEFSIIKAHPTVAYEILKGISFPWPVAETIVQHHERLDGSGYPHGIAGNDILLEARILAVADVVEAMSSHRPYRPALGPRAALDEIRSGAGSKYDKSVTDACVSVVERGDITPHNK